jgi:hypothetical protein
LDFFLWQKNPSHGVSLRAIENEKYRVVDKSTDQVLEEIEESRAFFQVLHPFAHLGRMQKLKIEINKKN